MGTHSDIQTCTDFTLKKTQHGRGCFLNLIFFFLISSRCCLSSERVPGQSMVSLLPALYSAQEHDSRGSSRTRFHGSVPRAAGREQLMPQPPTPLDSTLHRHGTAHHIIIVGYSYIFFSLSLLYCIPYRAPAYAPLLLTFVAPAIRPRRFLKTRIASMIVHRVDWLIIIGDLSFPLSFFLNVILYVFFFFLNCVFPLF